MPFYLRKQLLHTSILTGLVPAFLSCSTGKSLDLEKDIQIRKMDFALVSSGTGPRLSVAIEKNPSDREIDKKRRDLLNLVSGKISPKDHRSCLSKFKDAPECQYLKPEWNYGIFVEEASDEEESDADVDSENGDTEIAGTVVTPIVPVAKPSPVVLNKTKHKKRRNVEAVIANLRKGIIDPAPHQQPGDYYHALKKITAWTPEIDGLGEKLVRGEACGAVELYNYLGLKAEEFLPDEAMIEKAIALYRKGGECFYRNPKAVPDKYLLNSQFRLGLFLVMQERCGEAKPVFSRLAKLGVSEFSIRAHYWNTYCSKVDSKRDEFFSSYEQLFKANPLGFHTLSVTKGNSLLVGNLELPVDPIVKTRTAKDATINSWIETIEDMEKIGNQRGVMKLLSPVRVRSDYLDRIEPGVSLYLATFAYRAKDAISLFRLLDSVFRTQNEYVVNATMKLFYPLKYLEYIAERVTRVNPFLITALIRQESAFQEKVKSRVGATGLMQLMPRTARLMDRSVNKKRLLEPETNIRVGIRYFEMLVDRFEGDVELALAAYNAGPEAVDRWKKRYPMNNRLLFLDLIPYSETRNYVTLIGRNYYWYSKIYANDAKSILVNSPSNLSAEFRSLGGNEK